MAAFLVAAFPVEFIPAEEDPAAVFPAAVTPVVVVLAAAVLAAVTQVAAVTAATLLHVRIAQVAIEVPCPQIPSLLTTARRGLTMVASWWQSWKHSDFPGAGWRGMVRGEWIERGSAMVGWRQP